MTYINDALLFYSELRSRFMKLLTEEGILGEQVVINTKSLTPEEAIGITKRKDFPIITGKDVMVQAECMGSLGQAFTDAPSAYRGTLEEICSLDLANDPYSRGLFIAALNAVMKHLGRADCTVHCRNEGPESCAIGENPRTVAIMGLPGCVMYARRTIFDLVLPRIMADDQVTADDLAALGQGGLCLNCPECTFPNCGFGKGM